LGRICISGIFLLAVTHKIGSYAATIAFMESHNMIKPSFFLYLAILVEFLGGISLVLGFKTRYGAVLLLLFLVPVTFIFHDFWNVEGLIDREEQTVRFFSNLAIFVGLLYVFCCGPGKFSLDRVERCDDQ
jgi:putative oxidoreductase